MTDFQFTPIIPYPPLCPYIARIHVFESSGRLPAAERKLIVPNATFKLTLTYRNGIVAGIGGKIVVQAEHKLSLTGLIDSPVILDSQEDAQTGTIIIEFNPLGAYRFFRLSYAEIKNQIVELADVAGNHVEELQQQLVEATSVTLKLQILQQYLIEQLENSVADPIYDHCVTRIMGGVDRLSVAQLEKETGYSSRWLHRKFSEHLGTGPKNFSEIVRFKHVYHAYSTGTTFQNLKEHVYRYYYDQSHFLRACARFTGSTPTDLLNAPNELSTRHYKS